MGKEVIISELEYQKYIEAIDNDIQKYSDEDIFSLLNREEYFDFIHNKLGIRVSGFMVYDSFLDKHILYQNPLVDDNGNFYPQFPYKINKGKYEEIIDLAFLGNRDKDYRSDENDVPEFHKFFHNKENIHPTTKNIMHEFWDLNDNPKESSNIITKFHRPTGEILFFLYAWRYLIRLSSKLDLITPINTFEDFFYTSFSAPNISPEDWFKLTTGFDFSELFVKFQDRLSKKKGKLKNEEEIKNLEVINNRTVEAFLEYQKYEFNVGESTGFIEKEWDTLGINPYHPRARLSLHSLLKYAETMANYSGESNKSAERKKIRRAIKNAIESINNNKYEDINLEEIHYSLASIFYSLFTVEGNNYGDLFDKKFLPTVQFPIFPYFLEIFFDTDDGDLNRSKWHSPKEHLVFPIWYSKTENIEEHKQQESRYVAYVLLSMEPVWSFTDCFECYGDFEIHELNILRIKTLFQVINKTLVEKGFYVKVVAKQMQIPATKAAISDIINRNMAHHLSSHVSNRATLDIVLQRLKMDNSNLSDKNTYLTILDLLNRFNQYRDERSEYLTYITHFASPISSFLYQDVIRPFIENTLLMDNIAANENINYTGSCKENLLINKLKVKVQIQTNSNDLVSTSPLYATYFDKEKKELYNSENLPYFRVKTNDGFLYETPILSCKKDIEVSLPGSLGKHALYSILENFIRNSAKHGGDTKYSNLDIVLLLSNLENENHITVTLTDNCSKVSDEKIEEFNRSIQTEILVKKDLGLIDMKVNACLLAGKELTDVNCKESLKAIKTKEGILAYKFKIDCMILQKKKNSIYCC